MKYYSIFVSFREIYKSNIYLFWCEVCENKSCLGFTPVHRRCYCRRSFEGSSRSKQEKKRRRRRKNRRAKKKTVQCEYQTQIFRDYTRTPRKSYFIFSSSSIKCEGEVGMLTPRPTAPIHQNIYHFFFTFTYTLLLIISIYICIDEGIREPFVKDFNTNLYFI